MNNFLGAIVNDKESNNNNFHPSQIVTAFLCLQIFFSSLHVNSFSINY